MLHFEATANRRPHVPPTNCPGTLTYQGTRKVWIPSDSGGPGRPGTADLYRCEGCRTFMSVSGGVIVDATNGVAIRINPAVAAEGDPDPGDLPVWDL